MHTNKLNIYVMSIIVVLGGVIDSVLAIGPKYSGLKPGLSDGI
jgi:hypothetical protein